MKKYKKSLSIFMNRVLFPFSFCKSKRKEKKYAKIKKTKEEFIMLVGDLVYNDNFDCDCNYSRFRKHRFGQNRGRIRLTRLAMAEPRLDI